MYDIVGLILCYVTHDWTPHPQDKITLNHTPTSPLPPTSLPLNPFIHYTIFEWPLLQITYCRKFLFKMALLPKYFRPQTAILHYDQISQHLISHIETICSWRIHYSALWPQSTISANSQRGWVHLEVANNLLLTGVSHMKH